MLELRSGAGMSKRNLFVVLAIIIIGVVSVWLAKPWSGDPLVTASVLLFVLALVLASQPRLRVQLQGRDRMMYVVGGFIIAGSVGQAFTPGIWPALGLDDSVSVGVAVIGFVVGLLAIQLPGLTRNLEEARLGGAGRIAPAPTAASSPGMDEAAPFSGLAEAKASFKFVGDHLGALFRLVGVWALLAYGSVVAGFLWLEKIGADLKTSGGSAMIGLAGILALLLAVILLPPIAAISWARFSSGDSAPKIGSAKTIWSFVWRIWVASSLLTQWEEIFKIKEVAGSVGLGDGQFSTAAIEALFYVLFTALASQYVLILPAIALGDGILSRMMSARAAGRLGRTYIVGLLLVTMPFGFAGWILSLAPDALGLAKTGALWTVLGCTPFLLSFAGGAVAMTYLTRCYSAARRLDAG